MPVRGRSPCHRRRRTGDFTVNTVADRVDDNVNDGLCHTSVNTCSLRAAIMQANHLNTNGRVSIEVPRGTTS